MPIERILFPTKFRELAFNSLESLLVLKKVGLREVILCHVISREEVGFVPFGGYLKDEENKRTEDARIKFEDWSKTLSEKGISSKVMIVVGKPVPEILAIAEEEEVDLVVVGRKKRIETGKFFVGSHTHQIITRSKIPTLVSKYMVEFEWNDATLTKTNDRFFETPLLAVDWSELSERALEFLISLNGVVKKALVFHCIDIKISKEQDKSDVCRIEKECKKRLEDYCKKLKSAGIEAERHLGAGERVQEILRISRGRKASMIVIGNTCKDRLHEMLHKSISYQVAKTSELPTLLVP